MNFVNSQAETIKTRLLIFKAAGFGHQPFSYQEIINQIILCEAAQPYLYENADFVTDNTPNEDTALHSPERADKGFPMTTNVLQKWINGEIVVRGRGDKKAKIRHFTAPSNGNLMAIFVFLKVKNLITEADLIVADWPYAKLASEFLRYMSGQAVNVEHSVNDNPVTGEFYTFGNNNEIIQIRRLSVSNSNLPNIFKINEQTTVFKKWKQQGSSASMHINLELPGQKTNFLGWGIKFRKHFCIYLKSSDDMPMVHREYTLVQNVAEKLEFSIITSEEKTIPKVKNTIFCNNISIFIDDITSTLYNDGYKIIGSKLKLLKPFIKLNNTLNKTLYDCVKRPDNPDFTRFAELVESGADVNERIPGDMTLLHICAHYTSRFFLRELIKRPDLDYLVQDRKGYFPSMIAAVQDSGSSVYRVLITKERAAAFAQGIDLQAEQMEVLSPGWKLRTGWKQPDVSAHDAPHLV